MKKVTSYDSLFTENEKEEIKKDYIENGLSQREIYKKYNIRSKQWVGKILSGYTRTLSDAAKLSHKKHPDSFKHSEESKEKIRKAHIEWMKNNPEKTAWRLKNMSYPEKCFKKILEDNGLDKKYLIHREYSVFPYFIDFAFVDEKLAVEIDGSQHLEEDRKRKDEEKDKLLRSKGWRIIRIAASEVTHNGTKALSSLLEMLGNTEKEYEKVGILTPHKKKYEKVFRGEDGYTEKEKMRAFNQRKVVRPSKEELEKLIKSESFRSIGKIYGVSDTAVKKWCVFYDLPHRKKDMK